MVVPIEAKARLPQYGLDSVEGFCEGWGELDQLGDIASQMLNTKYPYMGSMCVSWKDLVLITIMPIYHIVNCKQSR